MWNFTFTAFLTDSHTHGVPTWGLVPTYCRACPNCRVKKAAEWSDFKEARLAIYSYIEGWYNPHRRHSSIAYPAPMAYESCIQSQA